MGRVKLFPGMGLVGVAGDRPDKTKRKERDKGFSWQKPSPSFASQRPKKSNFVFAISMPKE